MYTITIIETADELIRLARDVRDANDKTPSMGKATLIFENDMAHVRIEGDPSFELSEKLTVSEIIIALAKNVNIDVHIT